jgi:hypothetical protein
MQRTRRRHGLFGRRPIRDLLGRALLHGLREQWRVFARFDRSEGVWVGRERVLRLFDQFGELHLRRRSMHRV